MRLILTNVEITMMLLAVLISLALAEAKNYNVRGAEPYNCSYCQPEQIHIAFGEKLNEIVVTWSTGNDTQESRVQYGRGVLEREAHGRSSVFAHARGQYVHRVTLPGLQFDTKYMYHCGSKYGWSQRFTFKTPPAGNNAMVRAAIFGDMGVENAHSLPYLQDESERDHFDFILHVGDFAYDMYEKDGMQGDQFMRQIEPLAAIVPYMTVPGNHEENSNFTQYKSRFSMPGHPSRASMFYSWDIGPVHFVGVNTEAYYFLNYGLSPLVEMYEWLQQDLKQANRPENRRIHPWIVVYGHRPMYCSAHYDHCYNGFLPNRVGLPFFGLGMEPLLKQYGVDIVIWAHEHSYERTWPLYDNKVYNGSKEQPYVNPGAPVHVVTGSAGCRELPDPFVDAPAPWSAFRSSDYGYTRFAAHNHTHVYFEQVSVDKNAKVIDSFWVVKTQHKPYQLAPVHIITGSAGCREGRDRFKHSPKSWSAFRSQDFGYTRFKAFNKTHLNFEQVSIDLDGQVIDDFWIVKNKKNNFNRL